MISTDVISIPTPNHWELLSPSPGHCHWLARLASGARCRQLCSKFFRLGRVDSWGEAQPDGEKWKGGTGKKTVKQLILLVASTHIRAPCLSHIRREKSHHPHGTVAVQKVTSGSGKSHQGRRITMPQPVSPIIRDLVKSSRSIAHSDDFEGHKLVQTNSRQLILLDLNILY